MLIMVPKTSEKDGFRLIGGVENESDVRFFLSCRIMPWSDWAFVDFKPPIGKSSTYSAQTSANIHMNVSVGN
jgi:hypothetical protein